MQFSSLCTRTIVGSGIGDGGLRCFVNNVKICELVGGAAELDEARSMRVSLVNRALGSVFVVG